MPFYGGSDGLTGGASIALQSMQMNQASAQAFDAMMEKKKQERNNAKAAEYFFKANPGAMDTVGFVGDTPEEKLKHFQDLSTDDKNAVFKGITQYQGYQKAKAETALAEAHRQDLLAQAGLRQENALENQGVGQFLQRYLQGPPAPSPLNLDAAAQYQASPTARMSYAAQGDTLAGGRYFPAAIKALAEYQKATGENGIQFATGPSGEKLFRWGNHVGSLEPTGVIGQIDTVQKLKDQATVFDQAGDTETARKLKEKAGMLEQHINPQEEIITTTNPDGTSNVIVRKGGQKSETGTAPTSGFATKAQDRLAKYENAMELMNKLEYGLKAGHLGFKGVIGDWLLDKTAPQFGFDTSDKGRMQSRAQIYALREELMREMSSDMQRFSKVDRDAIEAALPETGTFESLPSALTKINEARKIMIDRSRVYANKLGIMPPVYAMTPDEILASYKNGKAAIVEKGLDPNSPEFRSKYLTEAQAMKAMQRFHLPPQ